jgi:hypothetical protein
MVNEGKESLEISKPSKKPTEDEVMMYTRKPPKL